MTGTWMHNHSLRLIYHHQIFILIKDVQWNILRKNIRLCQLRNGNKDLILLLYLIICLYRNPIYGNFLVLQQFLYIRSGKICIFFCKITVDPNPIDGEHVISSKQALVLPKLPETMIVVGSGAIGSEFAYFYAALGVKVTIVEYLPQIMPLEDEEVAKTMERSFRKLKATILTSTTVKSVKVNAEGKCDVEVEGKKGTETLVADIVLSAVGIKSNIEGIGLEELGIKTERDKVIVDKQYRTNVPGIYAIGDIVPGPALAHVASAEALCCVNAICGLHSEPVDYTTIPSCVFTSPEVASVGMTERQVKEMGIDYKVGRFPFTASGKATAAGDRDGFVKLIFDQNDKLLGAHLVGANVTEMLAEPTLAKSLGATVQQIAHTIHAHPTMNEGVMEAAEVALGAAIHV